MIKGLIVAAVCAVGAVVIAKAAIMKIRKIKAQKTLNKIQGRKERIEKAVEKLAEIDDIVYINEGSTSKKFHAAAHAHNMENAKAVSRTEAIEDGFVPCKACFKDK